MTHPAKVAVTQLREELGLTQRAYADLVGVDHSYLSRYERGQVHPSSRWLRRVVSPIGDLLAARHEENQ